MVTQYPDILEYKQVISGGQISYDEKGNPTVTEPSEVIHNLVCRAEANTGIRPKYITGVDGERIDFDWIVYLKFPGMQIPAGTVITVTRAGEVRASGTVKRCIINQLNGQVWV